MKPLNDREVKKGYGRFVLYLITLFAVSLLSLFCLIGTRKVQVTETASQLDRYDDMQNKQIILSNKMDSLLYDMSLLNTDKIQNSVFMQARISNEKEEIDKLMQSSDSSHFLLYRKIISLVNPMLMDKDSINSQLNREDFLKNSLFDCMQKYNDTKKKVDYNPVRFK